MQSLDSVGGGRFGGARKRASEGVAIGTPVRSERKGAAGGARRLGCYVLALGGSVGGREVLTNTEVLIRHERSSWTRSSVCVRTSLLRRCEDHILSSFLEAEVILAMGCNTFFLGAEPLVHLRFSGEDLYGWRSVHSAACSG